MNLVCRLLLEKNFFNDTATTEIYTVAYTLSLHDALPIYVLAEAAKSERRAVAFGDIVNSQILAMRARSEEHTSELQSR